LRRFVWPVSECPQESRPVKKPSICIPDGKPVILYEHYVDICVNRSHSPKTPTLPPAHFIVTRSVFVVQATHIQPYLEWLGKYFPCEP
jgi:hypothetical protein